MNLSLPQDKELIKNHMVTYLAKTGGVSKTLFGIELGTVCKIPTRGRTKLLIEAYPEVFVADGDMVHLRHPQLFRTQPPPPPPLHISQPFDKFFLPLNPAGAFSSGNVSPEGQLYQASIPPYPPPQPFFPTAPQQGIGKDEPTQVMYSYKEGELVRGERVEGEYAVKSGEVQVEIPTPSQVLEIIYRNGGSIEVSKLLVQLGARQQNPFEQAKLFEFLIQCSEVVIQNGITYPSAKIPDPRKTQSKGEPEVSQVPSVQAETDVQNWEDVVTRDVQTINVDNILIQNINIETLNLHLHIDDAQNIEILKLRELQQFMQEQFQAYLTKQQQM